MPRSNKANDGDRCLEAFQVDPSWYETHWLTERPPQPPGLVRRAAIAAARGVRTVLGRLPAATWRDAHSPMLSNAPRTRAW